MLGWTGELHVLVKHLEQAVASGVTPGGTLIAADGDEVVIRHAFGGTQTDPPEPSVPVDLDTRYDVASLTKPVATGAVLMKLIEAGTVSLDDIVPGIEPITVRHLAGHASGLPAHIELFRRIWAGDRAGNDSPRQAIAQMARQADRQSEPGSAVVYSDLGFILLADHLERVTGQRLDNLTRTLVAEPLGMTSTRFVDLLDPATTPIPGVVAPTEYCERRGLVCGEVHDENAHSAGGICGHAGLFSTSPDLARFAGELCRAARGEPSHFDADVVRTFFTTRAGPGSTWRLSWDSPGAPGTTNAGDLWPTTGVGHLGFTGCSMWLDPPRGRFVIMLTNRVHPSREKSGIKPFRRAVMDSVVQELNARVPESDSGY